MKKFHLITGLPRSGTTLLSTILRQNPKFESSISGPLARFTRAIIQESSSQGGYRHECPPEKRKQIIDNLFNTYYDDPTKEVAFNTNRGWSLLLPTVKDLYPNAKVIMCVRDMYRVINSFETLVRKQPYTFTSMFSPEENINVYSRAQALLDNNKTIGFAYASLKQGITSEFKKDIFILEYDKLARFPEMSMKAIYKFIGEEYFDHDYNNVEYSHSAFDEDVLLDNLHTTRKKVEFKEPEMVLPPDLIQFIQQNFPSVWK